MLCTGKNHTVCLSGDGVVHSFGSNSNGQLGLGEDHGNNVSIPTPIPDLPVITQISCGENFTVCVDENASIWSFGDNMYGQLGIGSCSKVNKPQQIRYIPEVKSISCGGFHLLIITKHLHLWTCGYNNYGQLALENKENKLQPQKTSFTEITQIAAGSEYSLFQNENGEIYGCGNNGNGQLALGHNRHQIKPCLINQKPNIIQFSCGEKHSLFLDIDGNVFVCGFNHFGSLGLSFNYYNVDFMKQILNIPPIQKISCTTNFSSCLLDCKGNIWSFGKNDFGQLMLGNNQHQFIPKEICFEDGVLDISSGNFGSHFFIKDSQNKIFAVGCNTFGQLGIKHKNSILVAQELSPEFSSIWGESSNFKRAKSARK